MALLASLLVAAAASWEHENLELPRANSAVLEITAANLTSTNLIARSDTAPTLVVWFYAPWCKQCKIARPGFEGAALVNKEQKLNAVYARLDCVKYPAAKKKYGVNSYPAFKVLRGERHRWIEVGRSRTEETIGAAAAKEIAGAFTWVETEEELRTALFKQNKAEPGGHPMDSIGQGEALALAYLPDGADGDKQAALAKQMYTDMASGCSVRLSPMPYVATSNAELLKSVDLPSIPPNHLAIIQLYTEPDGAPASAQAVPRLVSRPLVASADDSQAAEAALCRWSLGERLPLLINFEEDPYWGKRAGNFDFIGLHALLFLSPPHKSLAGVVRQAASRFERGQVIIMTFMVEGMDLSGNAMFSRYGIKSVLDTPKLVFLDQRLVDVENRQVKYNLPIEEDALVGFLSKQGLTQVEGSDAQEGAGKDEL